MGVDEAPKEDMHGTEAQPHANITLYTAGTALCILPHFILTTSLRFVMITFYQ